MLKCYIPLEKKYPYVTLEIIEGNSIDIRNAVEEYQVDFAITASPFGKLDYELLVQDQMIAVSKEALINEKIVDLHVQPERFIFCQAGYETTLEILRTNTIDISKSFIVKQAETVISLANCKNGIGILSKLVVDNTPNQLFHYPITPMINIDIGLVANNLSNLTPVATELKRMIIEFAQKIKHI